MNDLWQHFKDFSVLVITFLSVFLFGFFAGETRTIGHLQMDEITMKKYFGNVVIIKELSEVLIGVRTGESLLCH